MTTAFAIKSGTARSKDGAEKDRGYIVHIVPNPDTNGYWGDKAVCGTKPGKYSNGWYKVDRKPTCEKCVKVSITEIKKEDK